MMRITRLVVIAVLGLVAACSSTTYGSGGGGGTPGPTQVFMQSTAFNPATRTVSVGATVTWVNQDGFAHTVTYSSGPGTSFDSGSLAGGASYPHVFTAAGTYQYYCMIHGTPTSGMHATIVVQ